MKIFAINHTQIFVDQTSVSFWIVIADKRLRFLQTKHLQSTSHMGNPMITSVRFLEHWSYLS